MIFIEMRQSLKRQMNTDSVGAVREPPVLYSAE